LSAIAANPEGTRVYVGGFDPDFSEFLVYALNPSNGRVVSAYPTGDLPTAIAATMTTVYTVYGEGSGTVEAISLSGPGVRISVGNKPSGIAVNPAGTRVYVTNRGDGTVSVIDTSSNTVIRTITVGSQPVPVAASATTLYVGNFGSNNVWAIPI
jgi:YVTN family beta-propeller protein